VQGAVTTLIGRIDRSVGEPTAKGMEDHQTVRRASKLCYRRRDPVIGRYRGS